MWPILLDMSKEESMQHLRCLEIDAFSGLVNALRAQGTLNKEKLHLLRETSNMLHISQERHKAEIRRVVNDERLNTIAYHVNGERHCGQEWADEGQRLIPLMPRVAPQTAYSAIADEVADTTSKLNKQLPLPASTERKRMAVVSSPTPTASSSALPQAMYRNAEVDRKRKLSTSMENCVLAQHLMAPPKISKIQQIYRQRSKSRLKEQLGKIKPSEVITPTVLPPQQQLKTPKSSTSAPKINILQNITTSLPCRSFSSAHPAEKRPEAKAPSKKLPKVTPTPAPGPGVEGDAALARNASKTITTTDGQKLIVVSTHSNHTLTPPPSILQRTLTTVPFKTLSVNPKFRIVPKVSPAITKTTSASKQNVVAMRNVANTNKKVIPLSNVQVLNTKSGFKVLPMGAKHAAQKVVKSSFVHSKHSKVLHHKPKVQACDTAQNADGCITMKHEDEKRDICNRLNGTVDVQTAEAEVTTTTTNDNHVELDSSGVTEEDAYKIEKIDLTEVEECEIKMADDNNHNDIHTILIDDNGVHDPLDPKNFSPGPLDTYPSNSSDDSQPFVNVCEEERVYDNTVDHLETKHVEDIGGIAQSEIEVFEEKVDFDSSVFIYGESIGNIGNLSNHTASEEVIIDGVREQPTEVLNVVHALDETFSSMKNVRS